MSEMEYNTQFSPMEQVLDQRLISPTQFAYLVLRLDGKSFSKFTTGLAKPFDLGFMTAMDETAKYLAEQVQQVQFAMVQSDEISLFIPTGKLLSDSDVWFGGRVQKIVSVSAGMASAKFNTVSPKPDSLAVFDSRAFQLETLELAAEYAMYRRNEGRKNAISMAAETVLTHKELMGMSTGDRRKAYESDGRSLTDLPDGFVNGRMLSQKKVATKVKYKNPSSGILETVTVDRNVWTIDSVPNSMETFLELLA